jgi:uncharacterized protein (TIGR03067 family)
MRLTAIAFAWLLLLAATPARADEGAQDRKALQGTWELTGLVFDGQTVPADKVKGVRFAITGEMLVMTGLDGRRPFSFKLDPTRKPRAIDLTPLEGPFKGKTTPAIYELTGDTLRLCMSNKEIKDRPTRFEAPQGTQLAVFTLKRSAK